MRAGGWWNVLAFAILERNCRCCCCGPLSFRAHCVNTKQLQSADINKVSWGVVLGYSVFIFLGGWDFFPYWITGDITLQNVTNPKTEGRKSGRRVHSIYSVTTHLMWEMIRVLMMPLARSCGPADRIMSTILIGVFTQNTGYAKSSPSARDESVCQLLKCDSTAWWECPAVDSSSLELFLPTARVKVTTVKEAHWLLKRSLVGLFSHSVVLEWNAEEEVMASVARHNHKTCFWLAALQAPLLSDVAGGRHQGDVPGQQKDRQPSEDPHHLQQRQRLEVAAGPQQRPEGQQRPLCAGEWFKTFFLIAECLVKLRTRRSERPELRETVECSEAAALERSFFLIQPNRLTSHLRNTERKGLSSSAPSFLVEFWPLRWGGHAPYVKTYATPAFHRCCYVQKSSSFEVTTQPHSTGEKALMVRASSSRGEQQAQWFEWHFHLQIALWKFACCF